MEMRLRLALLVWAVVLGPSETPGASAVYGVTRVSSSAGTEYRFMYIESAATSHHFLSVIHKNGSVAVRAHPGTDPNGWGTSWYPQTFFAGARLRGAVPVCTALKTGIRLRVCGVVPYGSRRIAGAFATALTFTYDKTARRVEGRGVASIYLSRSPEHYGDLNLYKLASNYLHDVPLLSGGTGDTGDMSRVEVDGNTFSYTWDLLEQPGFFPQDTSDILSVAVVGNYNEVDTAAQGYDPIAAAQKPSVSVTYVSRVAGVPMIFGAMYDMSAATQFWSDNVGITPLILRRSTARRFSFVVNFQSVP